MSIKYFPFDSTFTGVDADGIPQGDRGATSADWAAYIGRMFTDGYFRLLDDQLTPSISETPMAVDIASGAAMIKGRQYSQDAPVTVSLGLSSSQPRIDRIVLRMSTEAADRKISLVVIKGTPASSPTAPALTRTASVYDICLAQISVGASAIQIVADNLTDTRSDDTLCGYVKILLDGRYYPDTTIPALLWVYTMYPDTLTTEQKAVIEGNTELIDIYEASVINRLAKKHIEYIITSGDWTVPDGISEVDVYIVNGGSNGTNGTVTSVGSLGVSGASGGAGGACLFIPNYKVTPADTVPIVVGAAAGISSFDGMSPSQSGIAGGGTVSTGNPPNPGKLPIVGFINNGICPLDGIIYGVSGSAAGWSGRLSTATPGTKGLAGLPPSGGNVPSSSSYSSVARIASGGSGASRDNNGSDGIVIASGTGTAPSGANATTYGCGGGGGVGGFSLEFGTSMAAGNGGAGAQGVVIIAY